MSLVDVTVVVCTYNRALHLGDTLASLKVLETGNAFSYEVVVVDNASTDDTPRVIEDAAGNSRIPLRGVRESKQGVACARNRGVQEARGTWIAFFDDDQVADPHWLAELLGMAREKGVRCVGGANLLRFPEGYSKDLAPFCRSLLGESLCRDKPHRYHRKSSPGAGNLLVQRSVFTEVGGFDESLREAGEDTDLHRRMLAAGIDGWYTPRALSYHVVPAYRLSESYLRWKSLRNGGHLARRDLKNWGGVVALLALVARLGRAVFLHWPRLLLARLRHAQEQLRGMRCRLWLTEGYARFALHLLAPRVFNQRRFITWLEFRGERELFCHG